MLVTNSLTVCYRLLAPLVWAPGNREYGYNITEEHEQKPFPGSPLLGRAAAMTGSTATAVGGRRLRRLAVMFAVTTDVYLINYIIVSTYHSICRLIYST